METSYLKAHPFGNCNPQVNTQSPLRPVARIRTHMLGDSKAPKAPNAQTNPLYRGGFSLSSVAGLKIDLCLASPFMMTGATRQSVFCCERGSQLGK